MTHLTPSLKFFISMAKAQAILTRKFDNGLNGLSLSDFMILYHLSQAPNQTMRRVDLAERIGLTASGVTRLLAPMEKIGLVKREASPNDARVSNVVLASGGKQKLKDSMDHAEVLSEDLLPSMNAKKAEEFASFLSNLGAVMG